VVLVESSRRILPALDERLAARATRRLKDWAIDVRLGTGVQSATATALFLKDGQRIPTRTIVVTTGIAAHPLLNASGLPMWKPLRRQSLSSWLSPSS